jgi:hypothetical protein
MINQWLAIANALCCDATSPELGRLAGIYLQSSVNIHLFAG